MTADTALQSIRQAVDIICEPGSVYELRAFGRGTTSGYFDDLDKLAEAAARLSGQVPAIYATINPVLPDLLARSVNRVKPYVKTTTSDTQIVRRCWLPIDFDAQRPADISSTDAEHEAAMDRARECQDWLTRQGWPEPLFADSGNGSHLLYRVELPNDQEAADLLMDCLKALSFRFDDNLVKVDTGNFNAARIWKLYGTMVCKGDSTEDRPHRLARILEARDTPEVVPLSLLEGLAGMVPTEPPRDGNRQYSGNGRVFDIDQWITEHQIEIKRTGPWSTGRKWVLEQCVWNPDHTDNAPYIVQLANGALAAGCHHNSCQGKRWPEFREVFEPGYRERRTGGSWESSRGYEEEFGEEEADWPEMGELPQVSNPPTLPADMVPEPLRPWLWDIARQGSFPLEMVAAPALVAASAIIGRHIAIRPWAQSDYTVIPNLWGGVVASPSTMKSYAIAEATKLLKRLAATAHERFQVQEATNEADRLALEEELEDIKKDMQDAVKAAKGKKLTRGHPTPKSLETLKQEYSQKKQELSNVQPTEHRYWVTDTTPEKLGMLLIENPNGLAVIWDELTGWLGEMDKPGREGSRSFYLSAWEGTGEYYIDRVVRGTNYIPSVCLSVVGSIQIDRLQYYLDEALGGGHGGDGMVQRFQLLVKIVHLGEWKPPTSWPDSQAKQRAFEAFRWLDESDLSVLGRQDFDEDVPYVRFSHEAQEMAEQWHKELEDRLRGPEFQGMPAFEAHIGKYRSLMPSLALIFQLLDYAVSAVSPISKEYAPENFSVSREALDLAIDWSDFLEKHARAIYQAEITPGVEAANKLAEKINEGRIHHGEPVRDIYRHGWSGLRTSAVVLSGLEVLESAGWIRQVSQQTGNTTTILLYLHPKLREASNG